MDETPKRHEFPKKRNPIRRERYLAALREGCLREEAARAAGVAPSTIWAWKKDDPEFRQLVDEAEMAIVERVEKVLEKRVTSKKCEPALVKFYLENRSPTRWQRKSNIVIKTNDTQEVKEFLEREKKFDKKEE